ncbi:MAG TPA: hypothetical protein VF481_02135 [Novosphingobium sp.]
MTDQTVPRPRHFWPVAAASLLWNLFGAYDWLMTNARNAAYLAQFPPEFMQYVDAMPYWALAAWTLGVWAAVAGSILLLRRSRYAVFAFAASLLGLAASTVYQASIELPEAMISGPTIGMTLVIWIGAIALLWYAMRMRARGILS